MAHEGGPYLTFAALCERALEEKDGVLSLIRVIDRVNVDVQITKEVSSEEPVMLPSQPLPLNVAIGFKSGTFRGHLDLNVRVETPSGFRWPEFNLSLLFEGDDDRGINVILPMQFPTQEEGIHWFAVSLGGELITRIPIRVVKRMSAQVNPPRL
jgi:hypothetical protein